MEKDVRDMIHLRREELPSPVKMAPAAGTGCEHLMGACISWARASHGRVHLMGACISWARLFRGYASQRPASRRRASHRQQSHRRVSHRRASKSATMTSEADFQR
jgi:hypothetical protein